MYTRSGAEWFERTALCVSVATLANGVSAESEVDDEEDEEEGFAEPAVAVVVWPFRSRVKRRWRSFKFSCSNNSRA